MVSEQIAVIILNQINLLKISKQKTKYGDVNIMVMAQTVCEQTLNWVSNIEMLFFLGRRQN